MGKLDKRKAALAEAKVVMPPRLQISSPVVLWALTYSLKAQYSTTGNSRARDADQMARRDALNKVD